MKFIALLVVTLLCVVIFISSVYMVKQAAGGPIMLSEDEIEHYVDAALAYQNGDKRPGNSSIRIIAAKDKVTVVSYNIFKQTVTVFFDETPNKFVVNDPNVDFTGCIIFHTILATIGVGGAMLSSCVFIQDVITRKKHSQLKT